MSVIWALCVRQQNGDWSHFRPEFGRRHFTQPSLAHLRMFLYILYYVLHMIAIYPLATQRNEIACVFAPWPPTLAPWSPTLAANFVYVCPIFKISMAKCISSFWKDYWYYSYYSYYSYYRDTSPTSIRAINPSTPFTPDQKSGYNRKPVSRVCSAITIKCLVTVKCGSSS